MEGFRRDFRKEYNSTDPNGNSIAFSFQKYEYTDNE